MTTNSVSSDSANCFLLNWILGKLNTLGKLVSMSWILVNWLVYL